MTVQRLYLCWVRQIVTRKLVIACSRGITSFTLSFYGLSFATRLHRVGVHGCVGPPPPAAILLLLLFQILQTTQGTTGYSYRSIHAHASARMHARSNACARLDGGGAADVKGGAPLAWLGHEEAEGALWEGEGRRREEKGGVSGAVTKI